MRLIVLETPCSSTACGTIMHVPKGFLTARRTYISSVISARSVAMRCYGSSPLCIALPEVTETTSVRLTLNSDIMVPVTSTSNVRFSVAPFRISAMLCLPYMSLSPPISMPSNSIQMESSHLSTAATVSSINTVSPTLVFIPLSSSVLAAAIPGW